MFETRKGYAVFLHAKSRIFKDIWWKPDFKGPAVRQTPHVTVYETDEEKKAKAVRNFLRAEGVEIVTHGGVLTVCTSKRHSLLSEDEHLLAQRVRLPQERITVKEGIFDKATRLRIHLEDPESGPAFQQMLL